MGSLTGLTQGRFPVHAKATYAGKLEKADQRRKIRQGANAAVVVEGDGERRGIDIFARKGAPAIAVNDGKIVRGSAAPSASGRFVKLLDVYGNTYTYGQPRQDRQDATRRRRSARPSARRSAASSGSTRPRRAPPRRRRRPPASAPAPAKEGRGAGQAAPVGERQDRRGGARQGAPVRPPGAAQRPGRRRRRPARPVPRDAARRLRAAGLRQEGLRLQAVPPGRPRDRRHRPRPHRQGQGRQGLPPALRDPARPAAAPRASTRSRSSTAGSCSSRPRSTAPRRRTRSSARTPRRPRSARSCS